MASPKTPAPTSKSISVRSLSITPGARVVMTPLSDDTLWTRLKEAGLDEESIKRRDKAALVSYIGNLEAQIFDLQHHMGLLILEKKELESQHEQCKATMDADELLHRRQQATNLSTLAESKKREENLKKALVVEKECIASLEKALHEMRAESAECKVAAESKFAEALEALENANEKFREAEVKLHAAESLQEEATRFQRSAERKVLEVETREADLSRRMSAFHAERDAKEQEFAYERQSLNERRGVIQKDQDRLLDAQELLNNREEHVANKVQELSRLEKELEVSRENTERALRTLHVEKSDLEITATSLSQRELAIIEKETVLSKREQELIILKEKLLSKESAEIQKAIARHDAFLRAKNLKFEAELEMKQKSIEDEIFAKRRELEVSDVDISGRETLVREREEGLETRLRMLAEREKDVNERMNFLNEKEQSLSESEKDLELQRLNIEEERIEIEKRKGELTISLDQLAERMKEVDSVQEKLEIMKNETNELLALKIKLKEEVDLVRAQKSDIQWEEERMKAEKVKFEAEWELIDEKRDELLRESERIAAEREAVSKFLKEERESLKLEKISMRSQHKKDMELLNQEREEYAIKLEQERSELFNKSQQERSDFLAEIALQKVELESSFEKRREELESYMKDKEKSFELERKYKLQELNSIMAQATNEQEQVMLELNKLDTERKEINLDREQREKEWFVLGESIDQLKHQTHKLEKQREALQVEREEICCRIEHLKKLEDFKIELDNMEIAQMQQQNMDNSIQKLSASRFSKRADIVMTADGVLNPNKYHDLSPSPGSERLSWIKRCTSLIFRSSVAPSVKNVQNALVAGNGDAGLASVTNLESSNDSHVWMMKATENFLDKSLKRLPKDAKIACDISIQGKDSEIRPEIYGPARTIVWSSAEDELQAAKKRKLETTSAIDAFPEVSQSTKKCRENKDGFNDTSVTPTKGGVSANHSVLGVKESTNSATITATDTICEINLEERSPYEIEKESQHSLISTSYQHIQGDGSNIQIYSNLGGTEAVTSVSGMSEISEPDVKGGDSDFDQAKFPSAAVASEDSGASNIEKPNQSVRRITRSKHKM